MDRFFCPQFPNQLGDPVELPDDEAHHVSRVLRKRSGDLIELFDGHGRSVAAVLVDVRKKGVSAEIAGEVNEDPQRAKQLVIAVATPKADRFKWMIEKATELGVDRVVPLECSRSVVHPGGAKLDKLRATIIAACKQSGRNRLMTLGEPTDFSAMLSTNDGQRWIADVPKTGATATSIDPAENQLVVIGPEGGWSDEEREHAEAAGFLRLKLGEHILRTETAAIAAAARFAQ